MIAGVAKGAYDVYAFTKTKDILIARVAVVESELDSLGSSFSNSERDLDKKADKVEVQLVDRKVDKILTGLCIINEKTCSLKD